MYLDILQEAFVLRTLFFFFFVSMWMQLSTVSRLKNEYFVGLIRYCLEADNKILVYEFATMGSLHDILHGNDQLYFPFWRGLNMTECLMFQGGKEYKGPSLVRF